MVGRIYHVGLTVSDLDRSIAFYRDILGLEFQGEIFMEGEETDKMFHKEKFLEANIDELKTLLGVALIQSTGASNRIEGIFTSDKRLEELVSQKPMPRDTRKHDRTYEAWLDLS